MPAAPESTNQKLPDVSAVLSTRYPPPGWLTTQITLGRENYEGQLEGMGSKELVKAMRDGDWNVVAGAFFDNISEAVHKLANTKQTTVEDLVAQWIESVKQEVKNGEWEALEGW